MCSLTFFSDVYGIAEAEASDDSCASSEDIEKGLFFVGIRAVERCPSNQTTCLCCKDIIRKNSYRIDYSLDFIGTMRDIRRCHERCAKDLPLATRQSQPHPCPIYRVCLLPATCSLFIVARSYHIMLHQGPVLFH